MTAPVDRGSGSRRAALAKARQSRRPSRLGTPAGAAPQPDVVFEADAGFPGLLKRVWQEAVAASTLAGTVDVLLTLGGHVPAEVQLRALRTEHACALTVLSGRTPGPDLGGETAFLGEIGLTTGGRVVVRVPSAPPLGAEEELVDSVLRVPWSAQALAAYQRELYLAAARRAESVADCRAWLARNGFGGRDELLERLKEAARRTAPFVLYQEGKRYTNFRDRNTMTGKTLWPGHPDCALSSLQHLPLELWSDHDVVLVVCLTLLLRSAGPARIEEVNGTQLTVANVAQLLEATRVKYNAVPGGRPVPPAESLRIDALNRLAAALRERRQELLPRVQLYREIHGVLMHKIERVAQPAGDRSLAREREICAILRDRLPVTGDTLDRIGAGIAASPSWLAQPHGQFGTGLESLVHAVVAASQSAFDADFAMSRGMRSLPRLIAAIRREDWSEIVKWEISEYFCCVVAAPDANRLFGGSVAQVADIAWAISSRMQYNSWHFIAGGLPEVPAVEARDYFLPPTIPDVAYYSDQHHHGHVAARVRFSIRSPQQVRVLDRTFRGFVDLRLLRCDGPPFDEADLLAAHRASALVGMATGLAAELVAGGQDIEVTAFDSQWHWDSITNRPAEESA